MYSTVIAHDPAAETHCVLVAIRRTRDNRYTLIVMDADTGRVLGHKSRSADQAGGPPSFSVGDALETLGGAYRRGYVEIWTRSRDVVRRRRIHAHRTIWERAHDNSY
jgi:hypothetical protein